jgi:hypothetical protein
VVSAELATDISSSTSNTDVLATDRGLSGVLLLLTGREVYKGGGVSGKFSDSEVVLLGIPRVRYSLTDRRSDGSIGIRFCTMAGRTRYNMLLLLFSCVSTTSPTSSASLPSRLCSRDIVAGAAFL